MNPFLLAGFLLAAGSPPLPDVSDWLDLSSRAAGEGDYGRALEYLERLEPRFSGDSELSRRRLELYLAWGQGLLREKRFEAARGVFFQALDLAPGNPRACKGLGYAAYYLQDLEGALEWWELALSAAPEDPEALEWKRKIAGERKLESALDESRTGNFIFRSDPDAPPAAAAGMKEALHSAYREVGYDLNYYPDRPIIVILYPGEAFRRLEGIPGWAGAIYDGKIRLPAGEGWTEEEFRRILRHEYTHALVHDLTRGRAPTWLQEGLAQIQEAKVSPIDLSPLRAAAEREGLIAFGELDAAFGFRSDPARARLAYLQAYSLLDHLIGEFGFWRLNAFLAALGEGLPWTEALEREFSLSPRELESSWRAGWD